MLGANLRRTCVSETKQEIRGVGPIRPSFRDSDNPYNCCLVMRTYGFNLSSMCDVFFYPNTGSYVYESIEAVMKTCLSSLALYLRYVELVLPTEGLLFQHGHRPYRPYQKKLFF